MKSPAGTHAASLNDSSLNVAVVQLECHPVLTIGARSFLDEPFVSGSGKPLLYQLADHGIDVDGLRRSCRLRYLIWHCARVKAVLDWFGSLPQTHRPDVIVFPEGSIPLA